MNYQSLACNRGINILSKLFVFLIAFYFSNTGIITLHYLLPLESCLLLEFKT